jgi:hypothetical protein
VQSADPDASSEPSQLTNKKDGKINLFSWGKNNSTNSAGIQDQGKDINLKARVHTHEV